MKVKREDAQEARIAQKNRFNTDEFEVGDGVWIRDVGKGSWTQTGKIVEQLPGLDGIIRSFLVQTADGVCVH